MRLFIMGNACCKYGTYASYNSGICVSGRAFPRTHDGEAVSSICSGGPGLIITGGYDGSATLWRWSVDNDAGDSLTRRWRAHPKPVTCVAHLPIVGRVLTGCRDGVVRLWPSFTNTDCAPALTMTGHSLTVTGTDGLEDVNAACSGSRDYSVRHWDLTTAQCVQTASSSRNVVTSLRRCPGECAVVQSSEDLRIRTWDVRDFSSGPCQILEGHVDIPHCVDVSPCGVYIVSCSNGFQGSGGSEVLVWDRRTERVLREWRDHDKSVNGCAFLPIVRDDNAMSERNRVNSKLGAGVVVVTASSDRTVRVFDYACERASHTLQLGGYPSLHAAHPVLCCSALEHPEDNTGRGKAFFAAGDLGGKTQVWGLNLSVRTGTKGVVQAVAHTL